MISFTRRFGGLALVGALLMSGSLSACERKDGGGTAGGAGAGATDSGTGDIKVGFYGSMTGPQAAFGQSSSKGVTLAIEEVNAAGGLLGGRKIKLYSEDDGSKVEEASTVVTKLVTQDKVVAVLGEVASSNSLAAAPICQAQKVPMISPSSTNEQVTQGKDYVFRVCFIDAFQGDVMAKFANNTLKAKNVAILKDTKSDYSAGLTASFTKAFEAMGGKVAGVVDYSQGDPDFRGQLTRIKGLGADAIFIPGYYNDVGVIAKQARELGLNIPLLGGDGWDSDPLFSIGGTSLKNAFYATHYSTEDPSPAIQNFIKAYTARFNETPDANAALGYDAAKVLADAITRANSVEGPKLRDAIAATKGYAGVTGTMSINAERNAVKAAVILECVEAGGTTKRGFKERIEP